MTRRRVLSALLCLSLLLLTGCWDLREMNHLALVMAVGIDKAEEPGRLQVTVQIARPKGKAGAQGGGGGTEQEGRHVYVATADGDTLFGAIRNLAQFTSRRIMWAHNNVVIIGESLAREDITPVIDFFTRNQELRMRTWVMVTRGSDARSIVASRTGMEEIPAMSISALMRYAQLPGESVRTDVVQLTSDFYAADREPVISAISLRPRAISPGPPADQELLEQAELAGSGIFHHKRLVGFVNRETGRGLLWLRREMENAVLTIPCPPGHKGTMAVEVRSTKVDTGTTLNGRLPGFTVNVKLEGLLSEQGCTTGEMLQSELRAFAEKELVKKIESEVKATLDVLQTELKVDAIGYGRLVHKEHPAWWRINKGRWEQLFPEVRSRVHAEARIPRMGLYVKPMHSKPSGGAQP